MRTGGDRDGKRIARVPAARIVALLLIAAPEVAGAATTPDTGVHTSPPPAAVRATLSPPFAQLGERVLYRGWVFGSYETTVRWLPPEPDERLTWGAPRVLTRKGWKTRVPMPPEGRYRIGDTVFVEIPLQAFALGKIPIPGLRIELDDGSGPRVYRLPIVTLEMVGTISPADSNADFRSVHGPLAAPWWERVPWTWVIAALLALLAVASFLWWRRHRKPGQAAAPAAIATVDPVAEGLAALAALRALHLPEEGRFAEHAFRLGQILRRYLEAVVRATRPGDTTPELVRHLAQAGLEPEDLTRLAGLLRVWDRVKFARDPFTLDEAIRAEQAVEAFLRRRARTPRAGPPAERVA